MRPDFAQGYRLSSSWLSWLAIALVVLATLACFVVTFRVRNDGVALVGAIRLSTSIIWWGGATVLMAFAQSARVLHKLWGEGLSTLLQLRAGRRTAWQAYLFGMVARLCIVALPPIALVGIFSLALAPSDHGRIVAMLVACLVSTLFFSGTLASVAMAALGGRSRAGGYLRLFAILTIPELVGSSLTVSKEMRGMLSVPSVLSTLVDSIAHGNMSRMLTASFVLVAVNVLAIGIIKLEWTRVLRGAT